MPLYHFLHQILHQVKPICLTWNEPDPLQKHLPDSDMTWPHSGFCLNLEPAGLTRGQHMLCVDRGYTDFESLCWCERFGWHMDGLLLFQSDEKHFEVVPLLSEVKDRKVVLPEMQLAFDRVEGGWTWKKSTLGPINACFHEVHIRRMDNESKAEVDDAVEWLGGVISLCLGTLYEKLSNPLTTYNVFPAKPAKMKMKGNKVVKIYKQATVGHLEIV